MAEIKGWRGVASGCLAVFSFAAMAQGEPPASPEPKWGAHIDAEAKPGNRRSLGEADVFLPLAQDERTLVFANLRGRFDDNSSREGNFGLGVRRMRDDGWNLGAYGYWDRRRTDTGNLFNQWTLGAEALGRDWDFRANAYIPQGNRVRDLGTTGGVSSAALSGASVQVTTTGTTSREERALDGYDAEVGWRLPLFAAEDRSQLRFYWGRYRFADDIATVSGPRVRAELAVAQVPGLWQGAQLFLGAEAQDDSARGSQSFVSIRLRIPFGGGKERPRQFSMQEQRMTAPVMRDVDIVALNRVSASTPQLVETATTTGGQAITALNSATTTTAAALNTALTTAGATTVILSGTFNTNAQINMVAGQTIIGGGSLAVKTASGRAVSLALSSATIAATGNSLSALRMANNATLSGMTITNPYNAGSGNGVNAQGFTGVTISNNVITVGGSNGGYAVDALNATNAVISGNTITATSSGAPSAIGIRTSNASITIANNTFSLAGTTQYVVADTGGTAFAAGSTGNVTNSGVCHFFGGAPTGSVGFSTISCP